MSKILGIEKKYAKFMMRVSSSDRLRLYRKLGSLLHNNFTLMDALDRIWDIESDGGKNDHEPMAIAIKEWQSSLEAGTSFAAAIEGWVPSRESLMLTVGDVSKLEKALTNVVKVSEGVSRITQPLIAAFTYPLFLLTLTVLIIIMVGVYLVPELISVVPKDFVWKGTAKTLVGSSKFAEKNWWTFLVGMFIAVGVIGFSFGFWKGKIRSFFDKFPPWSLYRMFTGVGWMFSLSSLVQAGVPISKALKILQEDSNPYLAERIEKTLWYISNGDNLGNALRKTGYNFPDKEVIGDLAIYSELDNFEEALESISNTVLEQSIKKIEAQAAILNTVAILLVAVTIAWVVFGTFEMQDQITSRM